MAKSIQQKWTVNYVDGISNVSIGTVDTQCRPVGRLVLDVSIDQLQQHLPEGSQAAESATPWKPGTSSSTSMASSLVPQRAWLLR